MGKVRPLIKAFRFCGRFFPEGLIRLGLIFGIGTCMFAIWLGRLDPESESPRISLTCRYEGIRLYEEIDGRATRSLSSRPCLLDLVTGQVKPCLTLRRRPD